MDTQCISDFIVSHYGAFSHDELVDLHGVLRPVRLRKGEYFARDVHRLTEMATVVKGSLYLVYINEQGDELIEDFFYESDKPFVFVPGKSSSISIRANEDSLLLAGNIKDFWALSRKHPRFYLIERSYLHRQLFLASKRNHILREHSPLTAIKMLLQEMPLIFRHFSYSNVAAYLGVHRNSITNAIKKM